MANEIPPPPPGYVLERPGNVPPPPPGYKVESRQQEMRSTDAPANPVIDDRAYAGSNLGIARASLATDIPTQIKRYSQQFGVPESYFGVIDGDIVRWVPEEKSYAKVVPSVTGHGIAEGAKRLLPASASHLGDAITAGAGAIGGALGGVGGGSIATAGIGGVAGDLTRQAIDKGMAPGESALNPRSYDYVHAGIAGAENASGQALGLGASKFLPLRGNPLNMSTSDRIRAATPAARASWQQAQDEAADSGVNLSVGQTTMLPSMMQKERQLGKMPETTDMVGEFQRNQRDVQIPQAFEKELGNLSPAAGREDQISGFREAADNVVKKASDARSAEAAPAFAAALDGKPPYYTPELDKIMRRPSMQKAWAAAQKSALEEDRVLPQLIDANGKVTTAPDWRSWEYIKRGLNDVVEDNKDPLTGKLNTDGRQAWRTQKELLTILDKANPKWAEARAKFGESSDAINVILDGGIGIVKKMNGPDRQGMVDKIFSGPNLLPGEITRMRKQFEAAGHADDWYAGLRGYLEGRLDQSMKPSAQGERGNVPGKIYQSLWGDEKQKRVLTAAIGDPVLVSSMDKFMNVMKHAAHTLAEGSSTAADSGPMQVSPVGPVLRAVGHVLSPMESIGNFGNMLVNGFGALRESSARIKLAEYMLSPQGIKDLERMRSLSPAGYRAANAAVNLLVNAGIVKGTPGPRDFQAPITQK